MEVKTHILLTGAGFTHNFGAPLAKGMWAEIFNHPAVQSSPALRELMFDEPNYKSLYAKVLEDDYPEQDKNGLSPK